MSSLLRGDTRNYRRGIHPNLARILIKFIIKIEKPAPRGNSKNRSSYGKCAGGERRDAKLFHNSRQFAAWLGLVPRQNSSGEKTHLLGICKRGETYLRAQC
jgi:hypothetical protein